MLPPLFAQQSQDANLIAFCCCNAAFSLLLGLIPFYVGRHRGSEVLGIVGLGACVVVGLFLTFFTAALIAIVVSIIIYVITIPASGDTPRRRRRRRPKQATPDYDRFASEDNPFRRDDRDEADRPRRDRDEDDRPRRDQDEDDRPPRRYRDEDEEEGVTRLPELDDDDNPLDVRRKKINVDDLPEVREIDEHVRKKKRDDERD